MAMNWQFKASCETQSASWVAYKEALINSLDRVGENGGSNPGIKRLAAFIRVKCPLKLVMV